MRDDGLRRGAWSGLVAGLGSAALMYVASALIGLRTLPELLQQPILSTMPGPVFGFLIDRLQHAGKVLEEAGLLLAMVLSLAALGAQSVAGSPVPASWPGPPHGSWSPCSSFPWPVRACLACAAV
jgi:hypothetical protein